MNYTPLGPTPYDQYREHISPYFGAGEFNRFTFDNGLSLSCIKTPGSVGYNSDLFEIAVLDMKKEKFVTRQIFSEAREDVIGFLTEEQVIDALRKVFEVKGDKK